MNDSSLPAPLLDPLALAPLAVSATTLTADGENDATAGLPSDHPAWQRDVLAISSRVRAILATLRPVVVTVQSFWDHVVRSASLGTGRTLEVDPSGCYRLR
ncbi:MAG TPA: hypothetical protein VE591_02375 [Candidatus Acidoferrum sp.]|nr:hypothetical protein [Candidatus Acidoferrum sp.]